MLYGEFFLEEEEEEYQDNENQKGEQASIIKDLTGRLEDLQTCNDLMARKGASLQRALIDLESLEPGVPEFSAKIKAVQERAIAFRIAANAMIGVSFHEFTFKRKKILILEAIKNYVPFWITKFHKAEFFCYFQR